METGVCKLWKNNNTFLSWSNYWGKVILKKRAETSCKNQKAVIFWLENDFLCVRLEICYRILSEQVFSFNYQGRILVNGILCILQWL